MLPKKTINSNWVMEKYISVHAHYIEDATGDIVDALYYCTDSCHRDNPDYNGWNGCNEIMAPAWCANCGVEL